MKEYIKSLTRNQFLRNVSTLAAGTLISQAVVVATSPLLSRLFSAEAFGMLSVFTSITVFFAVVSTGRYELALGLPECRTKALSVFRLILTIGFGVSLFYLGLILFLKNITHIVDKSGFLTGHTSYLAPFYIFLIAFYSGLGYWMQRQKAYKKITIANAVQVLIGSVFSLLFGWFQISEGLIYSLIIGMFVAIVYVLLGEKGLFSEILQAKNVGGVAREFHSFPKYMIFSDLSLTASQQFIPVLFSTLFSTGIVGLYSMANRMIRLPNIVITSAIGNIFRNDAIEEIREKGNCRELFVKTFKKLLFLSIPIYIGVFALSPSLFSWFLGKQWEMAGVFARILSVMLLFEFISTPLSSVFYIREKQKVLARIQMLNAVVGGLAIYLGYYFFNSAVGSLIVFVCSAVIFNLFLLRYSYKYSLHA